MFGRSDNEIIGRAFPRASGNVWSILLPAYSIEGEQMQPVTKITVFGVRLGIAVLAVYWMLIFVGTHLPGVAALTPNVHDKAQHFGAFFLLGVLLCYTTTSQRLVVRFLTIGAVGTAYAAVDELTQRLVPGRYPDVRDFVADTAGLWTAIALYVLAKLVYRAFKTP